MLSKFLIGQSVSAYTKDNRVFEGNVFKNKEGKKVVLAENGKWQLLENLKSIKQVGRKLNEENEQAIDTIISKLSPKKVADKEANFEELAKTVSDAAGISANDENRDDIEKYAQEQLVGLKAQKDANLAGNQAAMDKAADELKDVEMTPKEQAEAAKVEEAYKTNRNRLIAATKQHERRQKFGEDAAFDFLDDDEFDNYSDDEIYYDDNFEDDYNDDDDFTYDASDDLLDDEDYAETPIDDEDYSDIDSLVDTEFEDALDDYEAHGGDYSDEAMLESLANAFGGDAKKALKETSNIPDAVCHLAEQVKQIKIKELKK